MSNEIRADMLKVKRMISDVEIVIGKQDGETELVNKLIDAENLLTYCMSRLENAIVLPCKVGDMLYGIKTFVSTNFKTVYSFNAPDAAWIIEQKENFGKTIFLNKDEAESALKEGVDNG